MLSHALPMRELQRQEFLAEAAHERRLAQLVPTGPLENRDASQRRAALRQRLVTVLTSLRPAPHLRSPATAN